MLRAEMKQVEFRQKHVADAVAWPFVFVAQVS